MFSLYKCVTAAVVLLAVSMVSSASAKLPAGADSTPSHFKVVWKEGRLSVTAERASLSLVLGEVAKQTGLEIQGGGPALQKEISATFSNVSLSDGLHQLLSPMNYALLQKQPSDTRAGAPSALLIIASDEVGSKSDKTRALTPAQGGTQPKDTETAVATATGDTAQPGDDDQAAHADGAGVNEAAPVRRPPLLPDEGVNLATNQQPAPAPIPDKGTVIGSDRSSPVQILPDSGVNLEHQQSQSAQGQVGR